LFLCQNVIYLKSIQLQRLTFDNYYELLWLGTHFVYGKMLNQK